LCVFVCLLFVYLLFLTHVPRRRAARALALLHTTAAAAAALRSDRSREAAAPEAPLAIIEQPLY
jgi:hypothetical protein